MCDQNKLEELRETVNTLSRHWWAVFDGIEKQIAKGNPKEALSICQEAKAAIREALKPRPDDLLP